MNKSKALFGFAVLMLTASLIPACGGGGSGSAGAAPVVQTPTSEMTVYDLPVTGPHSCPGSAAGVATMVRNISFAPPISAEILRIDVECSQLFFGAVRPQFIVQLMSNGIIITSRAMTPTPASVYRGVRMQMAMDYAEFGTAVPAPYPNSNYAIRVIFVNFSTLTGSVDGLKVRVLTVENPTVLTNSPLIVG